MKFSSIIITLLLQTTSYSVLAVDAEIKPIVDPLAGTNVIQMILGLIVVLVLVFAIAWVVRRVGGVSLTGGGALKVISGMSMGSRDRVVLLQVGEEQLLLGVSPGRIQTLHVLENPIKVEHPTIAKSMFADKLAEVIKGKKK
ncbi:MAG: flagellar biosynthetic protein FliO [Sulfuriflexus sp.]|nr:flagellar biosynthetic protein FliO [Sulfuriflexus sp.]